MRWTFLVLVLASILLPACQPYQFKGTPYPDPQPAADFQLEAANGQSFHLSDQRGKVTLLYFGYTSCPDLCPTTLADASQVLKELGNDAERVRFLFVTVDPERDTPDVLAHYVAAFNPAIVGLTGTPDELASVRQAFGVLADKEAPDALVTHTSRVFLVDPEGRLRLSYVYGTPPDDMVQDIRQLLGS
jgi:protein SCO1/2